MRWTQAASGAIGSQGGFTVSGFDAQSTTGADADGEVVWFWRPRVGVKLREDRAEPDRAARREAFGVTGSTKPRVPEKSAYNP